VSLVVLLGLVGCAPGESGSTGPLITLLVNGVEVPLATAYYLGGAVRDLGNVDVEFTIRNDGDETLTLPDPAVTQVSGDLAIAVSVQPSTLSLAPGASTTFTLTLSDAYADGLKTAVYSIASADAGLSVQVTLTGYSTSQEVNTVVEYQGVTYYSSEMVYEFGGSTLANPVTPSTPVTDAVTIRNIGGSPLYLEGPTPVNEEWEGGTGGDEFAIMQQPSLEAINPGNTRDFLVRLRSDGYSGGTWVYVSIYSDDPDGTLVMYLSGYVQS